MNPVPLFLIIVSLPLLLGGCGEKDTITTKPELEIRKGVRCLKGSDTPYTGTAITYMNGQKKREVNYSEGVEDGLHTVWYENGERRQELTIKNGKPEGLQLGWHVNGQKKYEGEFKEGKQDGLYVEWYENGQKKQESMFKGDKKIYIKFWNRKGEPVDSQEEGLN